MTLKGTAAIVLRVGVSFPLAVQKEEKRKAWEENSPRRRGISSNLRGGRQEVAKMIAGPCKFSGKGGGKGGR